MHCKLIPDMSLTAISCSPTTLYAKEREMDSRGVRDGLEITFIGTLYKGPWEKKYWSCSRGKDRYPYPIGYQAVRNYVGHNYKMEIQEGAKGPVFVIVSDEGISCQGETPTIAWEKNPEEK